jgi:hypothetical protein
VDVDLLAWAADKNLSVDPTTSSCGINIKAPNSYTPAILFYILLRKGDCERQLNLKIIDLLKNAKLNTGEQTVVFFVCSSSEEDENTSKSQETNKNTFSNLLT